MECTTCHGEGGSPPHPCLSCQEANKYAWAVSDGQLEEALQGATKLYLMQMLGTPEDVHSAELVIADFKTPRKFGVESVLEDGHDKAIQIMASALKDALVGKEA